MNIFIDTNIIHHDPFWLSKDNALLLRQAKNKKITIYISEVVIKELNKGYAEQLEEWKKDKEKLENKAHNLNIDLETIASELTIQLEKINSFYLALFKSPYIHLVPIKNEMYPELLEMSIQNKEPFFKKGKIEYKDACIWWAYKSTIKENNLSDCFLLTDNTNDFCNLIKGTPRDKPLPIHPELKEMGHDFIVYASTFYFLQGEQKAIEKLSTREQAAMTITEENVHDYLSSFYSVIQNYLRSTFSLKNEANLLDVNNSNYVFTQDTIGFIREYFHLPSNYYDDIHSTDDYVLFGTYVIEANFSVFSSVDLNGNKLKLSGSVLKWIEVAFSFTVKNGISNDFEIEGVQILQDSDVVEIVKERPRIFFHGKNKHKTNMLQVGNQKVKIPID